MDNAFEDVKREYVNRLSETHGICLARNYDEFVEKVMVAAITALNETPEGRSLMDDAVRLALAKGLTPEQWRDQKIAIIRMLFFVALDSCSYLKHEFAHHLYNELRKENHNEQV